MVKQWAALAKPTRVEWYAHAFSFDLRGARAQVSVPVDDLRRFSAVRPYLNPRRDAELERRHGDGRFKARCSHIKDALDHPEFPNSSEPIHDESCRFAATAAGRIYYELWLARISLKALFSMGAPIDKQRMDLEARKRQDPFAYRRVKLLVAALRRCFEPGSLPVGGPDPIFNRWFLSRPASVLAQGLLYRLFREYPELNLAFPHPTDRRSGLSGMVLRRSHRGPASNVALKELNRALRQFRLPPEIRMDLLKGSGLVPL